MAAQISETNDLNQLTKLFFDGNKLQKEELRTYVLDILQTIREELDYYLHQPSLSSLWEHVSNFCSYTHNKECQQGAQRILKLIEGIDFWIREGVSSPERFEFFVLSKATELSTGDTDKDYYHALMIRHDQLLAVTLVFKQALEELKECTKLEANQMMYSPHFQFFMESDIDSRIFTLAEQFFQIRRENGVKF